ncbi:protein FAR-RED IMPAIRED RESPONSE 1-like [Spinacia oleracea]|uniref:Protein FAR-RED IMPAIRED RESPONSE 1-like n=1 Tax=Spinacia oleracea TaxID=3562 RepID=A0ABM3R967_SPIOL|nr:protein FAR-RED IMPAIRED RESPONSE 1-like [Spinacia oleracea]
MTSREIDPESGRLLNDQEGPYEWRWESQCSDDEQDPIEGIDTHLKAYGRQKGFCFVRRCGSSKKCTSSSLSHDGSEIGVVVKQKRNFMWTCECYGDRERKRKVSCDEGSDLLVLVGSGVRKSKKCECHVHIFASVNEIGKWVIRRSVMGHANHHPTAGKSRTIAAFRKQFIEDNPHVGREFEVCRKAGWRRNQVYNLMSTKRNGKAHMPFSQKDLHDYAAKLRKEKQAEDGRLLDVLWVDAHSRAAYEEFGDVVCFDTTYLTNQYRIPFANFIGVNHHGQSILLGCALVSRETADTFEWIFGHWLECMGGKAPTGILTDQDAAMRKALRSTMSQSCHRWCLWHITQKFCEKLGKNEEYLDLKEDLEHAIYGSLDADEFEMNWATVMERYTLSKIESVWLEVVFQKCYTDAKFNEV